MTQTMHRARAKENKIVRYTVAETEEQRLSPLKFR